MPLTKTRALKVIPDYLILFLQKLFLEHLQNLQNGLNFKHLRQTFTFALFKLEDGIGKYFGNSWDSISGSIF